MELLAILAVIAAGIAALVGVRLYLDRQDVAYTDPADGVSLRTDPPRSTKAPFYRFSEFSMRMPFDVQRLQDEGFDVTHFQVATGYSSRVDRPGTLVELPVDPPVFEMREGDAVPAGVGPRTAEELRYLSGVRVATAGYALLVVSISGPAPTVQLTALRLAKAIVADEGRPGPA